MADFTPSEMSNSNVSAFRAAGNTFSRMDQLLILDRFLERYTGDHMPAWAKVPDNGGSAWPLQFASDAEWLANTEFAISMAGRLDRRIKRCWEHPTWPGDPVAYGMLIRDLPDFVQARFGVNLRFHGWNSAFNKWLAAYHTAEKEKADADDRETAGMTPAEKLAFLADKYRGQE